MSLDTLREELCALHRRLPAEGLVAWTSGNISARVPDGGLLIKASGIPFEELEPRHMILCDPDGIPVEPGMAASSDARTHAYVYRALAGVGGIAHTHSPYATAWAARGEAVPCVLTAIADEFGGEIPVGPFALIGDEAIGRGVVAILEGHRSPAVLMSGHGVFTIGPHPRAALKAAVMCEDAARTVHLARQHGELVPLPDAAIDALHARYQTAYGQPPEELR